MNNVIRVAVVGATGYTGGELVSILARHPRAELAAVFSGPNGESLPFRQIHPSLRGVNGPAVSPWTPDSSDLDADVFFLAVPNEAAAEIAPALVAKGRRVVDLSGAFRLRSPEAYPEWYGFAHPAPELLAEAVYGLTERCNGELKTARIVANPGCYPTATLLALDPIKDLLAGNAPIVCDAKSGVSGAGKKKDLDYSFAELAGNFKAYGAKGHRHEPEIRQEASIGAATPFFFQPHLLPTTRGILVTLYVTFASLMTDEALAGRYEAAYPEGGLVDVFPAGSLPELRHVVGTPRSAIGFVLKDGGRAAVIVSVLDNLLKGAASQAVQNFNRMFGLAPLEGLE